MARIHKVVLALGVTAGLHAALVFYVLKPQGTTPLAASEQDPPVAEAPTPLPSTPPAVAEAPPAAASSSQTPLEVGWAQPKPDPKLAEKPATKPAAPEPKPAEAPAEKPAAKPVETVPQPQEPKPKPVEKPAEKPLPKLATKPVETASVKPVDPPAKNPAKPAEKKPEPARPASAAPVRPVPSSPAASTPSTLIANADSGYANRVRQHLARFAGALPPGANGEARVQFVVQLNGRVTEVHLVKFSGNTALDSVALNLPTQAQPLPLPGAQPQRLEVPVQAVATSP